MSSFMDQALDAYRAPTSDDLEIALPPRRESKAEPARTEPGDPGQHGGAADGSQGSTDAHNDDVASTAAEPEPQRDEPDDGEHTDSTEAQVAARAARQRAEAVEEAKEAPAEDAPPQDPEPALEVAPEPVTVAAKHLDAKMVLATTEGTSPRSFTRIGFSAGEGTPSLVLKRFPQPAIDKLRVLLAPSLGGEFAEQISAPALVTAFLVATIGVDLELDENTSAAADAFRTSDARIAGVEDRLDEVAENVAQLANAMKLSLNRIGETGNLVDNMEFAMAYLVADRVAGVTKPETTEVNVDVAQKKVLVARESIRKRAKAQRTIEKQRDGRRME
ncbi:hypothetical protein ACFVU2_18890 [Leifsonia sp. NPDC058194]|uniref:hypothetical protein n=1 Tax=Leifsonia sp. NPDC058194 TaxID=3346374 RepID=UPI0036DC78DE